ncbi:hypothetical protein Tco_0443212 [Tanacetum coccineum]
MGDSMQLFQQQIEAFMKRYNEDQQRIQSQFDEIRLENTNNSATHELRVNRRNKEGLDRGSGGTRNTNHRCKLDFPCYDRDRPHMDWDEFKDHCRRRFGSYGSPNLTSAMYFARLYERRRIDNQLTQQIQRVDLNQTNTSSSVQRLRHYVKRLSRAEIAGRAMNLCFNCDEVYSASHHCNQLFYIGIADSEDDQELHISHGVSQVVAHWNPLFA